MDEISVSRQEILDILGDLSEVDVCWTKEEMADLVMSVNKKLRILVAKPDTSKVEDSQEKRDEEREAEKQGCSS